MTPAQADLPVPALREALLAAGYTYDGVAGRLGPLAHAALGRNETTPGLRATRSGDPLDTLTRLWLLQAPVPAAAAEAALPGLVDRLAAAGVLAVSVAEVAARVDVRPYRADDTDLWIASDPTPGLDGGPNRVGPDHVLGISSASTSLARLTVREPVGRALDLGTGCGVQALHLAGHAGQVVATDVNPRALWLTRLNAALNEVRLDVRPGSLFEPVADETFDLVVTNPPFVISPATGERLVYRDSGLPGDQVVEDIVRGLPARLRPGGWGQVLANWVHRRSQDWRERLGAWLAPGCDALVVQREVIDPAAYVEMWLRDAGLQGGPEYLRRYDTWLSWFDDEGVEGIGFGWVALHRTDASGDTVRHELLDWPYDVEQPIAPAIADWGRAAEALRDAPDVLERRWRTRVDVRQETLGEPGAADPESIVIRQQRGFRRARAVDTVAAALVGASDGDLTAGQILAAVAELLDLDAAETMERCRPIVAELVAEEFLVP